MQNKKWMTALACGLALFTTACGSSNTTSNGGVQNQQANAFVGNYLGRNTLNAGQRGELRLNVNGQGNLTGTYSVFSAPVSPAAFLIPTGVYDLTGSVDLATGTFRVSGVLPGFGPFTVDGILPLGGALNNFTVNIAGQTFTGQMGNTASGNVPGGPSGTSRLINGGSLVSGPTFVLNSFNGLNPPISSQPFISGTVVTDSPNNTATISLSDITLSTNTRIRGLVFGIVSGSNPLPIGTPVSLATAGNSSGSFVSYSDTINQTIDSAWAPNVGSQGQVTIISLTDTAIEVEYNFTGIVPNTEVNPNNAQGSFDVSGRVIGNFFSFPQP